MEERGEKLIKQMTKDVEDIRTKLPQEEGNLRILVFDSGEKDVFTAAQNFMNELVTVAGAKIYSVMLSLAGQPFQKKR